MDIETSQLFIKRLFCPRKKEKNNFSLIVLENGSAGLTYTALSSEHEKAAEQFNKHECIGNYAVKVLENLIKIKRTALEDMICMGLVNALSHAVMGKLNPDPRNYQSNYFDSLNLQEKDHVGMVGFFPPVVKRIEKKGISLTVLEKKKEMIQSHKTVHVTLDPKLLLKCNKVIITATTILNNTLDEILPYCRDAEIRIMIGPTAGFLPEPLFARNIDIIGGSCVINSHDLIERLRKDEQWGSCVDKYCILK